MRCDATHQQYFRIWHHQCVKPQTDACNSASRNEMPVVEGSPEIFRAMRGGVKHRKSTEGKTDWHEALDGFAVERKSRTQEAARNWMIMKPYLRVKVESRDN